MPITSDLMGTLRFAQGFGETHLPQGIAEQQRQVDNAELGVKHALPHQRGDVLGKANCRTGVKTALESSDNHEKQGTPP